ncbi:hypothetical protein EYC80_004164 [Monilinia laxa]|uniref:Uncharacterized protein n=1 Tax=Monilinia laxa TaxID=61186 RepID=A0A5N6KLV6_MONLA|nr:hypothetical protein EYC80_004164 [Monilinia laxa]
MLFQCYLSYKPEPKRETKWTIPTIPFIVPSERPSKQKQKDSARDPSAVIDPCVPDCKYETEQTAKIL